MNVIFLDFDGVISVNSFNSDSQIEEKIKILAKICHDLDCKVVISSAHKDEIDEDTLEINVSYDSFTSLVLQLFKKYNIECIGRTPSLKSKYYYLHFKKETVDRLLNSYYKYYKDEMKLSDYISKNFYSKVKIWKEDEIRIYLMRHPEIEHYCIIDDDDLGFRRSDLSKVKKYLLKTDFEQGILESHEEKIKEILKQENTVRSYVLKRK